MIFQIFNIIFFAAFLVYVCANKKILMELNNRIKTLEEKKQW